MTTPSHAPVLLDRVVALLTPALGHEGAVLVDATLGLGGHSEAVLARCELARVVGIDRDPEALRLAGERLAAYGDRFTAVHATYDTIPEVLADLGLEHADGVLFDLGVSSMQLGEGDRGFSFRTEGPLDMRMAGAADDEPSARDLVNELSEGELADLLYHYGDERRSRRIAAAIVRRRPIETTDELAGVIVSAVGRRPGGPHPARRSFQALRIAVNRELEELTASLPHAAGLLDPGGRVVVISYHSLEDGAVKRSFRDDGRLQVLTRKPVTPTDAERAENPRARSAKLRAAERIEDAA